MGIRLYADNACDLDKDLLDELGVKLFYLTTNINDNTYKDRLDLSPQKFYELISKPDVMPTTAQIPPIEFQNEFEKVIKETDDDIIYVAFSSGLSGTYQSAYIAGESVDPNRITVIDSQSASVGYGLTVIRAAEALKAGKNKQEIIEEIKDNINRMQHLFIVGNFEMLKRGGRVSATSATIGNLLNIKLILHLEDGKIYPLEKVHGLKKAKRRMLDIMNERGYNLKDQLIGINYSNDYEGALTIRDLIQKKFGCEKFIISEIGATIGSHVGAGTYSIFFLSE
ncbi:DegV family protein [Candidatus Syntrophocurvum alkaliphilum]|uniref:DegV family protein n=1 Tax=Candidatus Syntrophocurvum alkaliphilum TaxID=2293317 RepID=A0A6I6D5M6_9FIRM|nr:DegV family protein [Candidatus Syntrophocurvum alkaliphilum]QGT98686.1 DegV family protein [Candidatus Syntrophocurvum alkaliphilum]